MFFDNVIENDNREGFVSTFLGYNHNPIISEAEFYEMEFEEFLKDRLRDVVRHEFRHHMENLGGVYGRDSLEYEDKVQLRQYLKGY